MANGPARPGPARRRAVPCRCSSCRRRTRAWPSAQGTARGAVGPARSTACRHATVPTQVLCRPSTHRGVRQRSCPEGAPPAARASSPAPERLSCAPTAVASALALEASLSSRWCIGGCGSRDRGGRPADGGSCAGGGRRRELRKGWPGENCGAAREGERRERRGKESGASGVGGSQRG